MKIMHLAVLLFSVTSIGLAQAKSTIAISSYEDNYFMGSYSTDTNEQIYKDAGETELESLDDFEVKYQISLSLPLLQISQQSALMAAYTQRSLWQMANREASSPFRETNYQPQLFMLHNIDLALFNSLEYGYKHQSNGRGNDLSRSWERYYFKLESIGNYVDYGVEYWSASGLSDNRDIEDYIGPYAAWVSVNGQGASASLKVTHNFDESRSGIEAGFTYYLSDVIGLYAQVWSGYGETLIDYNNNQTRYGLGIRLRAF